MEALPVFSPLVNNPEDMLRGEENKIETKKMEYRGLGKYSYSH